MIYDTVWEQEELQVASSQQQVVQLLREGSHEVCPVPHKRRGRRPSVTWSHLIWAILLCFLDGWNIQREVWRRIISEPVGPFAAVKVGDQAIYNRIARAEIWMQRTFEQVSAWLRVRLQPWEQRDLAPWASAVYAADASTLDRLGRYLPWLRQLATGSPDLLAGQISALLDVRRQQWERIVWGDNARDNCKVHFLEMVKTVQAGALLLFDRGYLSFAFFDHLSERGIWWISRYGNQVGYSIAHICYQGDGVLDAIVQLGKTRDKQAQYPVRLIQFWLDGKLYRYFTNVLDPHQLSVAELVKLYQRRWDIELAFRALKEHLNVHHLWSAKAEVIRVQLWAALILAQAYHALQVECAGRAGVETFDVSLSLLIRSTPRWLAQGLSPIEQVLCFGEQMRIIRPSTRRRWKAPFIDPAWVVPPPPEAIKPLEKVRHRSYGPRSDRDPKQKPFKRTPVRADPGPDRSYPEQMPVAFPLLTAPMSRPRHTRSTHLLE